jgi:two-component system, NarL family, response regulator LiaR
MDKIRVLIVDDHAMFRDGLRAVLEHADDMELVGEAGDGETAIIQAAELQPDIVLMDLHMPGLGGIEATRSITAAHPRIKIIALSMYQDDRLINSMVGVGAKGYILKDARATELLQAIRTVAAGGAALDPAVLSHVLVQYRRLAGAEAQGTTVALSKREVAILQGLAEGLSNQEIATRLHLSQQTIKNTLSAVYVQLRVSNRTEAVVEALRQGIIQPPS